ncbi:MAG: alginate export family protein [Ignavibacteria bacterium]|nr:alginate export family protein [Ignavibacteria bacterium]
MKCFFLRCAIVLGLIIQDGCGKSAAAGEPTIRWKGEIRVRGELDGRDFLSRTPANAYTLLRVRVGAEFLPSERVAMVVMLQDSRVFGTERAGGAFSTISNTANVDLYEGYLTVNDLFTEGLQVTGGRMGLAYGNERIIGTVGWSNIGRVFDGILFRYTRPNHSVDLFVTNIGQTTLPPAVATPVAVRSVRDSGQTFSGIHYSFRPSADEEFDGYFFHQWNRMKSFREFADLSRFTLGAFVRGPLGALSYTGEFAYQFGTIRGVDISAFLIAALVRYPVGGISVGVGFDYLSGTAEGGRSYQSFDPAFHTGHRFYGHMDYFINIPQDANGRGLRDFYIDVSGRPTTAIALSVRLHHLMLAKTWSGQLDLGQEIDMTAAWEVDANVSIEAGASGFVPGTIMRSWFNGSDIAWWGYLTTRAWL